MIRSFALLLLLGIVLMGSARANDGASLFKERCLSCHDSSLGAPAPSRAALRILTPDRILRALEPGGSMSAVGATLTGEQHRELAHFLSGRSIGDEVVLPQSAFCDRSKFPAWNPSSGPSWRGWGVDLANSRFQPSEAAGLAVSDLPRLKLNWAFGFRDSAQASAQPVLVGGRLFVGSDHGEVYSLDSKSGCIHWRASVEAGVRGAVELGQAKDGKLVALFGDKDGNVYGLDAVTGSVRWKRRVDEQPHLRITGSVKYHDGRVYVPVTTTEESIPSTECCKARGALVALDASTGKQIWKTYTVSSKPRQIGKTKTGTPVWGPSGVGIWNSPTLDLKKNLIYVGTGNSTSPPEAETSDAVLALDLKTGKIRWHRKFTLGDIWNKSCRYEDFDPATCPNPGAADEDFGASIVLVELSGGRRILLGPQKSAFNALNPENGEILWRWPGVNTHWGVTVSGETAYVPRPLGGLDVFDLVTGKKRWQSPPSSCEGRKACDPGESAAITSMPGAIFSGTLDGRLRAVSSQDGKLLWEFDTVREYSAVNGVPAHGGTIDGAGPSIAGGMLFVCSGYSKPLPGNVLLAFSLDGR